MNEDFKYIVTPAAFDIKSLVPVDAPFTVDRVYGTLMLGYTCFLRIFAGSPGHTTTEEGVLCEIASIFASQKESAELTKGGVVVVRLNAMSTDATTLPVVYDLFFFCC